MCIQRKKKSLLSKYDEEEQKSFVLNEKGDAEKSAEQKLASIRQKLKQGLRTEESLEIKRATPTDYYSQGEMVQFKASNRPTKKRRIRKKKVNLAELIGEEYLQPSDTDLGTREDRQKKHQDDTAQETSAKLEKKISYQKALEKASQESKYLFEEEDEEEDDLYKSLARARKFAAQNKKSKASAFEVAKAVEEAAKKRQDEEKQKEGDKELVFTATSEFVRGIDAQEVQEVPRKRKNSSNTGVEDANLEAMEVEETKPPTENQPPTEGQPTFKIPEKPPNKKHEKPEGVDDILGEEALVGKGVGAALDFLKQRGGISAMNTDTFSGRATDKPLKLSENPEDKIRLEYLDAEGQPMTPKEAFRHLSHRFHGKMPSKNKLEKRIKKKEQVLKQKQTSSFEAATMSVQAMMKTQQEKKTPYIVISGGSSQKLLQEMESSEFKEVKIEKKVSHKKPAEKKSKVQFGIKKL